MARALGKGLRELREYGSVRKQALGLGIKRRLLREVKAWRMEFSLF